MIYLIYIAIVVAVWHYFYEGIIAPSIRIHLRNELFKLRDELRNVHCEGLSQEDFKTFTFVHDGINNFINRLPNLTMERTAKIHKVVKDNPELSKLHLQHVNAVQNTSNQQIAEIFNRTNIVIAKAFLVNMGGWFIFLVPLAITLGLMKKVTQVATELLVTPRKQVERFLPVAS